MSIDPREKTGAQVGALVEGLKESAQSLQRKGEISAATQCEWAAYFLERFQNALKDALHTPAGAWPPKSILDVLSEVGRQNEIWGKRDHPPLMWFSIIGEEFGEMCQAFNEFSFDNQPAHIAQMKKEAVQVAASCVSMLECLERMDERGRHLWAGER